MAIKRLNSEYYNLFYKMLTKGANAELLKRKETVSEDKIKGFSPNNVRRVVLGQDGIFVQYYVTTKGISNRINFQEVRVTEGLLESLCVEETQYRAPLQALHLERVFSSIEEIIIIPETPNSPNTFVNTGLEWFDNEARIKGSFRRLRGICIIQEPVSVKEFIAEFGEAIYDETHTLIELTNRQRTGKEFADKDYLMHTSLRPQYYELDEKGGVLDQYFERVKTKYQNELLEQAEKDYNAKAELEAIKKAENLRKIVEIGLKPLNTAWVSNLKRKFLEVDSSILSSADGFSLTVLKKAQEENWVDNGFIPVQADLDKLFYACQLLTDNVDTFAETGDCGVISSLMTLGYLVGSLPNDSAVEISGRFVSNVNTYSDDFDTLLKVVNKYVPQLVKAINDWGISKEEAADGVDVSGVEDTEVNQHDLENRINDYLDTLGISYTYNGGSVSESILEKSALYSEVFGQEAEALVPKNYFDWVEYNKLTVDASKIKALLSKSDFLELEQATYLTVCSEIENTLDDTLVKAYEQKNDFEKAINVQSGFEVRDTMSGLYELTSAWVSNLGNFKLLEDDYSPCLKLLSLIENEAVLERVTKRLQVLMARSKGNFQLGDGVSNLYRGYLDGGNKPLTLTNLVTYLVQNVFTAKVNTNRRNVGEIFERAEKRSRGALNE